MRKRRTLVFQQITDSRFMEKEKCLPVLIDRIGKIKQLLDINGVFVDVGEPYLLNWDDNIQYRADFYMWDQEPPARIAREDVDVTRTVYVYNKKRYIFTAWEIEKDLDRVAVAGGEYIIQLNNEIGCVLDIVPTKGGGVWAIHYDGFEDHDGKYILECPDVFLNTKG